MPDKSLPRLGRLHTLTGCRRELAAIYAAARSGTLPWADAERAGALLAQIAALVEVGAGAERDHRGGT